MTPLSRTLLLCLLALAGYAAGAQVFSAAARALTDLDCASGLFTLTCRLEEDGAVRPQVYAFSAAGVAVIWAAAALCARQRLIYPFAALFCLLALGAMAYDVAFGNRLVAGAKLANDTFNVLRFVIFASFILTFTLLRAAPPTMGPAALAIGVSQLGALAFMGAFIAVRGQVIGALELLLLYGAYAFGGFTIHLMTVSLMVTSTETARPGVSAARR